MFFLPDLLEWRLFSSPTPQEKDIVCAPKQLTLWSGWFCGWFVILVAFLPIKTEQKSGFQGAKGMYRWLQSSWLRWRARLLTIS